jgi:hypothetical protein
MIRPAPPNLLEDKFLGLPIGFGDDVNRPFVADVMHLAETRFQYLAGVSGDLFEIGYFW